MSGAAFPFAFPPLQVPAKLLVLLLAAGLALGLGGCSSIGGGGGGSLDGDNLTIYTSLPLHGPDAAAARDVLDAEKLALADAGGQAGTFKVGIVALDDTARDSGRWEPGRVAANARKAAQDRSTMAYIGELDNGASAISIPILNESEILTVSPGDAKLGLTQPQPGAVGEPEKFYPTNARSFARVVPNDAVEAEAATELMRSEGAGRVVIAHDARVAGAGLAKTLGIVGRRGGIDVAGEIGFDLGRLDVAEAVAKVLERRPASLVWTGDDDPQAAALLRGLVVADPSLRLYVLSGAAEQSFAARLGAAGRRTTMTTPVLPPRLYPAAGRRFFERFEERFGRPAAWRAIFGYEAMRATIATIARAGPKGADRTAVIRRLIGSPERPSPLGPYAINDRGDTSLRRIGVYAVRDGRMAFERLLEPQAG